MDSAQRAGQRRKDPGNLQLGAQIRKPPTPDRFPIPLSPSPFLGPAPLTPPTLSVTPSPLPSASLPSPPKLPPSPFLNNCPLILSPSPQSNTFKVEATQPAYFGSTAMYQCSLFQSVSNLMKHSSYRERQRGFGVSMSDAESPHQVLA